MGMPLPDSTLPSQSGFALFQNQFLLKGKGSRSSKVCVPQYFEVAWPGEEPVIQSGGFLGFFHDFYHITTKRPYQRPPKFDFIRILVNPQGAPSKPSLPRCLAICSSVSAGETFFNALLRIRIKEDGRDWSRQKWMPLHEMMNSISVTYQIMFQKIQIFIESRIQLLQKMVRPRNI